MGNCKSSPATTNSQTLSKKSDNLRIGRLEKRNDNYSTAALFRSLFTISRPILQRLISKQLIEEVGVLKNEVKVESFDENCELPILPLVIDFENIQVVDAKSLRQDMTDMPDFAWPLRDEAPELIRKLDTQDFEHKKVEGLLVLDIIGFQGKFSFEKGHEIVVPIEGPLGLTANLEIGTSKEMPEAWVQIDVPKLRIWYVCHTQMLFLAFMGRPDLKPCLHVNADFGKGDMMNTTITDKGSLDEMVERILTGFGPKEYTRVGSSEISTVGDKIGQLIVRALARFQNVGNGKPIEVELGPTIEESIKAALYTKHRPITEIKADIERLQEELALAEKYKSSVEKDQEEKKDDMAEDLTTPQTGIICGVSSCI